MNTVLLTFDRDHTHAGETIKRGAKRELPAHTADWLIAQGVAHVTPSNVGPSTGSPSPTPRDRSPRRDTTGDPDHAAH